MAIVTISRGTFSGGLKLAEILARELGYRCVGREEITGQASKQYNVSEEKLLTAILKRPSALKRFTYERERYLAFMQAVLCQHAKADNMVYHGNAGHFLLKGVPHLLRVRIVAPLEVRVKFVMERQQLLHHEAVKYIEGVDKERIKWTKFLYGVDWSSPDLYDIVFNLETENMKFVSAMIEFAVEQELFKTTPHSQEIMENLALGSLVQAAIASDPRTRNVAVSVRADGGVVTISGKVQTREVVEAINQVSAAVPGVKEIVNEVGLDYRYQHIDT